MKSARQRVAVTEHQATYTDRSGWRGEEDHSARTAKSCGVRHTAAPDGASCPEKWMRFVVV
jgi:hypothetical protein